VEITQIENCEVELGDVCQGGTQVVDGGALVEVLGCQECCFPLVASQATFSAIVICLLEVEAVQDPGFSRS